MDGSRPVVRLVEGEDKNIVEGEWMPETVEMIYQMDEIASG